MKRSAEICLVLTNHNGFRNGFLPRCLGTLSKALDNTEPDAKLIIVDDCSQDKSLQVINKFRLNRRNQVHVLNLKEQPYLASCNLDVTAAINFGIRYALREYDGCEYIITLDNDIALSKGWIQEMAQAARSSDGKTGMLASNQYMLNGYPDKHRSTGHYVDCKGATLDRDFQDKLTCRCKTILCPCISGAVFKTAMLRRIGLVPEYYRHYNNCSEMGFRAQLQGWKVEFVKSAVMWHRWQGPPLKRKREVEISRIWNILRFFPKDEIASALEPIRKRGDDGKELIKEATQTCPFVPSCEKQKKRMYQRLISVNTDR